MGATFGHFGQMLRSNHFTVMFDVVYAQFQGASERIYGEFTENLRSFIFKDSLNNEKQQYQ